MFYALTNFQKNIFVFLLYSSSFFGFALDLAGITSRTAFYAGFDVIMIFLALTSLSYTRGKLGMIIAFFIICMGVNISYSQAPLYSSLNGMREILTLVAISIYYTKIFAPGNEEWAEIHLRIFKKFVIIFLALNLPISFYQFFKYGPSDQVGGSMGNWGSGVLTLTIICVVFYLQQQVKNLTQSLLVYLTLIPLVLNETKISFILIPALIVFIYFEPKVKNILLGGLGAVVFLFIFNAFYSHSALDFGDNKMSNIFSSDFLDEYLFGDIYWSGDIPRFTRIIIAWQMLSEQVNTFLFGIEYGMFKGTSMVGLSHFAESYFWLLTGTRPYLFFLMLQGGVLLVTAVITLVMHINKNFRMNNNKFKTFLLLILGMVMFYNDALRNQSFICIYFFLIFYVNSSMYEPNYLKR